MKIFNKNMRKADREQPGGSHLKEASPAWEIEIREQLRRKDYGAVLDTLAKMAEAKMVSSEAFYAGAYAYFMRGDYERAAAWVGNVLTYAPRHVAARILLARLCILEDRATEALSVMDLLLEAEEGTLTEKERDEIREIVGYYGRTRRETVCKNYPHIAAFLRLEEVPAPLPEAASGREPAQEADGVTALARQKLDEVCGMDCTLREKVGILCSFAGAWYFDGHLEAAKLLLDAAASMDAGDAAVLRGLALIAAESGDMDRALRLASAVHPTDFILLGLLRDFARE